MHAADTSWLYALFEVRDEHHGAARREAATQSSVLVNPAILVEFLDLVRTKHGLEAAQNALEDLLATPTVRLVAGSKPAQLARIIANHPKPSWHDATAIATALDEGADLRTFDKDQRKAFEALR